MQLFHVCYSLSQVNENQGGKIFVPLNYIIKYFVLGIFAVVYAVKALHCQRRGYYEQALIHARRSFSWSLATYVIALFVYLTLGLIVFIRTIDHH